MEEDCVKLASRLLKRIQTESENVDLPEIIDVPPGRNWVSH